MIVKYHVFQLPFPLNLNLIESVHIKTHNSQLFTAWLVELMDLFTFLHTDHRSFVATIQLLDPVSSEDDAIERRWN